MFVNVVVLAAAVASSPPLERFQLDAPLLLTASAPASGVETVLVPWVALRGGHKWDLSAAVGSGLALGGDAALWLGGIESEGTAEVNALRGYAALEARALASWRAFETTHSALEPFAFVGLRGGGGVHSLQVFDDQRTTLVPHWASRGGVGLDVLVHAVLVRAELGAGVRDGRFELTSGISLGASF